MRAIKFFACVFAACCPLTADAFVYRSALATRANGNSISRQQQPHEIVWKNTNKDVDSIVAKDKTRSSSRSAGDILAEVRVRIARVPSALYPEGVVRRVGSPLRMMFEDGSEVSASSYSASSHIVIIWESTSWN